MNKQAQRSVFNFLPLYSFFLSFFLLSTAYSASVTLVWTAPDDSRVTGYKIYYGTSDPEFKSVPQIIIDSADQTRCPISDLQENQTYYFAATSFDSYGNESGFSETIKYQVKSQNNDPNGQDPEPGTTESGGGGGGGCFVTPP